MSIVDKSPFEWTQEVFADSETGTMDRQEALNVILPFLKAARLYHRHEVVGLENIPQEGSALIVVNHSLATYDITLLLSVIYFELRRLPRPLIDRTFFRVPFLGELCEFFGAVQGSPTAALDLLRGGDLVTVAPGGMREALRPSTERYQIRWDKRLGFVRLAMKAQSPVILAACPKADDMYDVYQNPLTSWFYKNFKLPLPLARGFGMTPLPRPVKLVHFLSEPIMPPSIAATEDETEKRAKDFHKKLMCRMHDLIGDAIQYRY